MAEQPGRPRHSVRQAIKIKLLVRDGLACWWCNKPFRLDDMPTIEHVEPVSNGGTWALSNLRLTHEECNKFRSNHYPLTYKVP